MVNLIPLLSTTALLLAITSSASTTLHSSIRHAGKLYFGTTADHDTLKNPNIAKTIQQEFGALTPEYSMKWSRVQPHEGNFTLTNSDWVVGWAVKNRKRVRGHTLVWHDSLPAWVANITEPERLTMVLKKHISMLVERYKGRVFAWDVVNEIFNEDGTYRDSIFHKLLGQDFVKTAFLAAHAADPSARLYLNDYNLDYSGPKLDAVIKLARSLRSEGIPIHGIGTQAHLQLETDGICNLTKPLAALASTGLEIAITELDIRVALPATRAKLAAQELGYRHAVRACMHTPKCVGVTVWGVDDKDSWVRREINGMGAALLFDDFYKKKPAYYGCLDGING